MEDERRVREDAEQKKATEPAEAEASPKKQLAVEVAGRVYGSLASPWRSGVAIFCAVVNMTFRRDTNPSEYLQNIEQRLNGTRRKTEAYLTVRYGVRILWH